MDNESGRIGKADRVLSPSATEPEVSAHSGDAPLRGGSSRGGGDRLAYFLAQKTLSPFVSKELEEVTKEPIRRSTKNPQGAALGVLKRF